MYIYIMKVGIETFHMVVQLLVSFNKTSSIDYFNMTTRLTCHFCAAFFINFAEFAQLFEAFPLSWHLSFISHLVDLGFIVKKVLYQIARRRPQFFAMGLNVWKSTHLTPLDPTRLMWQYTRRISSDNFLIDQKHW